MDTAQWAQGIGVVAANNMDGEISKNPNPTVERKARPQKEQALNCPRCNSTNTKFCYYNNYSLSQPRYFCKTCRRYWTEGGSLRNVPVGGGSRKNKRPSSLPSNNNNNKLNNNNNNNNNNNPPSKIHQPQDLNLAYPPPPDFINDLPSSSTTTNTTSSRGLGISSSFMPTMSYGSTGFGLQEFKPPPGLTFSLDGFENNGYGGISGIQQSSGGARMLFPMEDLKHQIPTTTTTNNDHHDHHHYEQQNRSHHADSSGFWNGMLGGGSW